MKRHQEEMLFRTAANSYVEQEDEQIRREMEEVDEVFKKMAENNPEFHKLLDREFSEKKKKTVYRIPKVYKVAVLFLILGLSFSVSVMTVPALKSAVIDFVNYVTGRYSDIGVSSKEELETGGIDVEESDLFEKEYHLTYLPEGFVLESKKMTQQEIICVYLGENGEYINFRQNKDVTSKIDSENANTSNIDINGRDALMVQKDDQIILIMNMEDCQLILESDTVSKENMIAVAKGIQ